MIDHQETPLDDPRLQAAFESIGWELVPAKRSQRLAWRWIVARARLRHLLLGCQPAQVRIWDAHSGRLVDVGRMCPVCDRQYPG